MYISVLFFFFYLYQLENRIKYLAYIFEKI